MSLPWKQQRRPEKMKPHQGNTPLHGSFRYVCLVHPPCGRNPDEQVDKDLFRYLLDLKVNKMITEGRSVHLEYSLLAEEHQTRADEQKERKR